MDYDPRQPAPDPYGSYDAYGSNGSNDPYSLPAPYSDPYEGNQGNHASPTGARRRSRGPRSQGGANGRNAWLALIQASNPLDEFIYRFQHHWETSAEYRRTASIVIAVSAVVLLCGCVSLATIFTTSALASAPTAGGPTAGNTSTGTNAFSGPHAFPTNTVPAWPTPVYPNPIPNPNSQTPQPSPTVTGTPSATTTPGNPVTTCNGGQQGVAWDMSPCPQAAGQGGQLHVYARHYKNTGVNIIINFGCSGDGCTLDFTPDSTQLDGTGNLYLSYTVPAAAANSQVNITGFIQPQGGPQVPIVAAPVQ